MLQEELAKGRSVKQAIKNSRIEVEAQDLQQDVQVVISQLAKVPVLAVAPPNKDEEDTCDQGADCASLDIGQEGDEITFLDTAQEPGSWSTMANGQDIVTKQTKVADGIYDMQCWDGGWVNTTRVDTTEGGKLYECNGHIILVGSQAALCTPTLCQNGGTCTVDGISFACECQPGFSGDFCEVSSETSNCYDMDCSDFGGYQQYECSDCSITNCCNYPTRESFNTYCDTLTATQDYVAAKCCHRTFCI